MATSGWGRVKSANNCRAGQIRFNYPADHRLYSFVTCVSDPLNVLVISINGSCAAEESNYEDVFPFSFLKINHQIGSGWRPRLETGHGKT